MMKYDEKNECPQHETGHQWEIIRTYPPLSECKKCDIVVNSLKGDYKEFPWSTEKWTCKICKKIQNKNRNIPNLNDSFCSKCWKEWKEKSNPLLTTKQATDDHPHFKNKPSINCKICRTEDIEEYIPKISCPNCNYPALKLVTNRIGLEFGAEICCDACLTHWKRTKNW